MDRSGQPRRPACTSTGPWLNRVGIATGLAGVATTTLLAPEVITSLFGAGCIVWFTWLGIHLVRGTRAESAGYR